MKLNLNEKLYFGVLISSIISIYYTPIYQTKFTEYQRKDFTTDPLISINAGINTYPDVTIYVLLTSLIGFILLLVNLQNSTVKKLIPVTLILLSIFNLFSLYMMTN